MCVPGALKTDADYVKLAIINKTYAKFILIWTYTGNAKIEHFNLSNSKEINSAQHVKIYSYLEN